MALVSSRVSGVFVWYMGCLLLTLYVKAVLSFRLLLYQRYTDCQYLQAQPQLILVYHPGYDHCMDEVRVLLEELAEQGWQETEIAARLGVSQATINRWRRGERSPPLAKLVTAELRRMLRLKKRPGRS